ncbi:MAG: hypothetical protein NZO16_02790, partial [Deltaproteobacteria bacterium]|nr:hypothetical protein [Deltaproteobacteria bacterium]
VWHGFNLRLVSQSRSLPMGKNTNDSQVCHRCFVYVTIINKLLEITNCMDISALLSRFKVSKRMLRRWKNINFLEYLNIGR